jgi:hypothetical protein
LDTLWEGRGVIEGKKIYYFQFFFEKSFFEVNFQKKSSTDRLGAEKGKNLKLENFFLPLFCVIFGKKSQRKWLEKKDFGQSQMNF